LNILDRFLKNPQISDIMKIRQVGAELFHAAGETDRHNEANSRCSQFSPKVPKNCTSRHS